MLLMLKNDNCRIGHLDSVHNGPGIHDNGSGSAALLAILSRLCDMGPTRNRVRFAWRDGEELDLQGSKHYVDKLSEAERNKIRFYFNYDMVGSRPPNWNVLSALTHDAVGADILVKALKSTERFKMSKDAPEAELHKSLSHVSRRRIAGWT
ncbi:hypothetical protein CDD80_7521 [Ophiocordyceps camponoti-rufipedis]|uniref:Peptide hydrolase n=1 Tax=Ophiocordyceps camponoti-rufipedis TaxID=2004952 RepID=A0A2C5YLD6_9HYPO|nr:hypothetical protein CDD80_7521 [Ophiocordyceps camponoti-rufipedis]